MVGESGLGRGVVVVGEGKGGGRKGREGDDDVMI